MIDINHEERFVDEKTFFKVVSNLEQKIEANNKRIEAYQSTPVAQKKSFKEQIRKAISLHLFSRPLDAKKIFRALIWLVIMIPLFVTCMILVYNNYEAYTRNEVVTQIKLKESNNLTFPALTLCPLETRPPPRPSISHNLSEIFSSCSFEGHYLCSLDDFESVSLYDPLDNASYNCFKINGGKNATSNKTSILNALVFGKGSGFSIDLYIRNQNVSVGYFVGDTGVKPVFSEMTNLLQPGRIAHVSVKKSVDVKLPEPYNNCKDDIDSETSDLVKEILEQNITYRQINCYDLCYYNYQKLSQFQAYTSFNYIDSNCTLVCPLECVTNSFEVTQTTKILDGKQKLIINVFYGSNKYTDVTQSVKTSITDLIANTGGVLGLFLEVTFISAYRFFIIVFDIIF